MSYDFPSASSSPPSNELHMLKFYRFHARKNCWKHVTIRDESNQRPLHHDIAIVTWNVDFQGPKVVERMHGALEYLRNKILKGNTPPHCVIMLQEVHSKALPELRANPWVRKHFYITPIDNLKWPSPNIYGNVTLIQRTVSIKEASVLYFASSNMSRTALVTDIRLAPEEPERYQGKRDLTVRIINTHLESLGDGAQFREDQLSLCVKLLKEETVYGGVMGGDFNAIDEDSTEQVRHYGLIDPGEPSDVEHGQESHTWGFHQPKPWKYPTGRLDKIIFTPSGEFTMDTPAIFGQNAKTEEGDWVSDHFGLVTDLLV